MKSTEFGVITFKSTHHAIRGESILEHEEIDFKMIPTPREITHSCGLSIRFDLSNAFKIKDIIANEDMDIEGIFKLIKDDKGTRVEKVS